jgi:nucleoside-diphosphate-sugar epimerase
MNDFDRRAFVLGASGQVGAAAVRALAEQGWEVTGAARRSDIEQLWPAELGVKTLRVDRDEPGALESALTDGYDVLVDCVAYSRADAAQIGRLASRIGSVVVISTVAVYADDAGRNFADPTSPWPYLPMPIPESQPTAPVSDTPIGRKVGLERAWREQDVLPVTIFRPGAIYGPFSHYPREWYFVKRALDRRPVRIIKHGGQTVFHTTSATSLGELIALAAADPANRILNAGDSDPPPPAEIGRTVSAILGHEARDVVIDGEADDPLLGDTPWSAPRSVVLDTRRAEQELGYRPRQTYAEAVEPAVRWQVDSAADADWREVFPYFYANQGEEAFDYAREDAWLASHRGVGQ